MTRRNDGLPRRFNLRKACTAGLHGGVDATLITAATVDGLDPGRAQEICNEEYYCSVPSCSCLCAWFRVASFRL